MKTNIISHESEDYKIKRSLLATGQHNGAYYYSKEIVENIIPRVKTDRPWVTVNMNRAIDRAIVFIHSNISIEEKYSYLGDYEDLILVCSVPETMEVVAKYGTPIYVPLSVDVDYVSSFKVEQKSQQAAWAGNRWGFKEIDLMNYLPPAGVDFLTNMPRDEMLRKMATYYTVYAIGRCAIEAKILGCNVKTCDHRFPDSSIWKVVDNKEAAKILQEELNKIDGGKNGKSKNRNR